MTLEKLARITASEFNNVSGEFKAVRKEMANGFMAVRKEMATDLEEVENRIIRKTIESNDKVVTKLDVVLKEFAAYAHSHRRIDDTLLDHESRLKKVESSV